MGEIPINSILLIEDIDSIFVQRLGNDESNNGKVSFSGLLNALDGVRSPEHQIICKIV